MNVASILKALSASLKFLSTTIMSTSSLSHKIARFILCLIGFVRLAILLTSISRKAGTLMLPLVQDLWQSWSSFVLTPSGLSTICLLISVSCSTIILSSLLRILRVLKVSLTSLLTLLKRLAVKLAQKRAQALPAQQQAKALADIEKAERKIEKVIEVVKDAEQRLYTVRHEPDQR